MSIKNPHVLVAEDDDDDFFFVERAFRKAWAGTRLQRAADGEHVVRLLKDSSRPHVILLDLKMPRMNGFEVLQWLRSNVSRTLPVLVFSSSGEVRDVEEAYQLGATSFFVKPSRTAEYEELVRAVAVYWFDQCRLPRG